MTVISDHCFQSDVRCLKFNFHGQFSQFHSITTVEMSDSSSYDSDNENTDEQLTLESIIEYLEKSKHPSSRQKSATPSRKRKHPSSNLSENERNTEGSSLNRNSIQIPDNPEASTSTAGTSNQAQMNEHNNLKINNKILEILKLPLSPNFTPIPEKLSHLLSLNKLSESESSELMRKYRLPENFKSVRPEILPAHIISQLPLEVKGLEELHVIAQIHLSAIISAVLASLMNVSLGLVAMNLQLGDTKQKLEDIALLTVDLQLALTILRRKNIIPKVRASQKNEINRLLPISRGIYVDYGIIDRNDENMLIYLKDQLSANDRIPIKDLQLKLVYLLQLRTRKNIITISNIKLSGIAHCDNFAKITIANEGLEFKVLEDSDDPAVCPVGALKSYVNRTNVGRGDEDYLFLQNKKMGDRWNRATADQLKRTLREFREEGLNWILRYKHRGE